MYLKRGLGKGSAVVRGFATALLLLFLGLPRLLADDVGWGPTVADLRLGAAIVSGDAGPELRIDFANVAHTQKRLWIAAISGGMPEFDYAFDIYAVGGPNGKEYRMFYWRNGGVGNRSRLLSYSDGCGQEDRTRLPRPLDGRD
jgi:hypothetical protein